MKEQLLPLAVMGTGPEWEGGEGGGKYLGRVFLFRPFLYDVMGVRSFQGEGQAADLPGWPVREGDSTLHLVLRLPVPRGGTFW